MKNLLFKLTIVIILLFGLTETKAQVNFYSLGFEGQVYPTGYLLGLRAEVSLANKSALELRVGTNIFDHQDFGVQDEEEGEGYGFTLGYRYYFSPEKTKWFAGVRADFWWNDVRWKNDTEAEVSEIFVVQPTAIAGYVWRLGDHFQITPTASFGFEVNMITKGEPTGQGAILLGGINLDYKF